MQDKLQALTDKLFQEGLTKGKEEGEKLLSQANEQASQIIAEAKNQAEKIKASAMKDAENLKSKVESDLRLSAAQTIQTCKKDVENLILAKILDEKISTSLKSSEFIKNMLLEIAKKFSTEGSKDLELILPSAMQAEIEPFIKAELSQILDKEVKAEFSKKISGGFIIKPQEQSYYISLSEETFSELICEYLRPTTQKILFEK